MRNIESDLHDTLLEIAPEAHDLEEQALIVATAASIYKNIIATKTASKGSKYQESQMTDAILQALGRLAEDSIGDYVCGVLDGTNLSAEQIVHQASITPGFSKFATEETYGFYGKDMDILNDDDLSIFLTADTHDAEDYEINDSEERHHPELYSVPGTPHHWTDFQSGSSGR